MSEFLLREIVGSGLCGGFVPAERSRPALHHKLDLILLKTRSEKSAALLEQESGRVQLCNQSGIAYEDQPFAHLAMIGMSKRLPIMGDSVVGQEYVAEALGAASAIRMVSFRDMETGAYVEPYYGTFLQEDDSPVFSILAAYLQGDSGAIKVDVVPMLGDGALSLKYWSVDSQDLQLRLHRWRDQVKDAGPQCASCARAGCEFQADFQKKFLDYMKKKQAYDEAAEHVRQHLIYRGPSEVGYHTAYMKQGVRRSVIDGKLGQWFSDLLAEIPNWKDFVKPDGIEIVKAIKANKLDKKFGEVFKESSYYTIDTKSNLGTK